MRWKTGRPAWSWIPVILSATDPRRHYDIGNGIRPNLLKSFRPKSSRARTGNTINKSKFCVYVCVWVCVPLQSVKRFQTELGNKAFWELMVMLMHSTQRLCTADIYLCSSGKCIVKFYFIATFDQKIHTKTKISIICPFFDSKRHFTTSGLD